MPWRRSPKRLLLGKDSFWDAHIAEVIGKRKIYVGKMDATLTDSHLDTINRIKICILMNCDCAKARMCGRSMGREREVVKTAGNSTDDSN